MGWQVGDRVGISSTAPSSAGTGQTFTITALDDSGEVTVDGTGDQDHRADFYPPTKQGEIDSSDPYAAAILSAEVVNLSRNIIITGDDYRHVPCDAGLPEAVSGEQTSTQGCRCATFRTKCTVGLHTAQMHAGSMSIQSVRVEKCGQRGIEVRMHCEDCTENGFARKELTGCPLSCMYFQHSTPYSYVTPTPFLFLGKVLPSFSQAPLLSGLPIR